LIALLEAECKTRSKELATVTQWTEAKMSAFAQATKVYGEAAEELPRRARGAELYATELQAASTEAEAAIQRTRKTHAELAASYVAIDEPIAAQLREASKLHAAALEDLPRRTRAAELALAQIPAAEPATANLEASAACTAAAAAVGAQLGQLRQVYGSAMDELRHRMRGDEQRLGPMKDELAKPTPALESVVAVVRTQFEKVTGDLAQAGKALTAAAEELPRRARSAEQRLAQLQAEPVSHPAAIEPGTQKQWFQEATARLAKAAGLYASAGEEIARRARLAELTQ
jgi:chromosome segregation ATPase